MILDTYETDMLQTFSSIVPGVGYPLTNRVAHRTLLVSFDIAVVTNMREEIESAFIPRQPRVSRVLPRPNYRTQVQSEVHRDVRDPAFGAGWAIRTQMPVTPTSTASKGIPTKPEALL